MKLGPLLEEILATPLVGYHGWRLIKVRVKVNVKVKVKVGSRKVTIFKSHIRVM